MLFHFLLVPKNNAPDLYNNTQRISLFYKKLFSGLSLRNVVRLSKRQKHYHRQHWGLQLTFLNKKSRFNNSSTFWFNSRFISRCSWSVFGNVFTTKTSGRCRCCGWRLLLLKYLTIFKCALALMSLYFGLFWNNNTDLF